MPSPIGHSLMGYIIHRATARPISAHNWSTIALYLFAANAPDLDFILGLFVGQLSRFHHGPSHSIGFAILFAALASFFFRRRARVFVIAFSLYLSHVLLDYLIQDPSPPYGVPLFWPLSYEYYMAPFAFFRRFDYASHSVDSLLSLMFTLHNLLTVLLEVVLLLPLLILVVCARSKPRHLFARLASSREGSSSIEPL
jgi:inner membrane protein